MSPCRRQPHDLPSRAEPGELGDAEPVGRSYWRDSASRFRPRPAGGVRGCEAPRLAELDLARSVEHAGACGELAPRPRASSTRAPPRAMPHSPACPTPDRARRSTAGAVHGAGSRPHPSHPLPFDHSPVPAAGAPLAYSFVPPGWLQQARRESLPAVRLDLAIERQDFTGETLLAELSRESRYAPGRPPRSSSPCSDPRVRRRSPPGPRPWASATRTCSVPWHGSDIRKRLRVGGSTEHPPADLQSRVKSARPARTCPSGVGVGQVAHRQERVGMLGTLHAALNVHRP
jgi:hypothetical protein